MSCPVVLEFDVSRLVGLGMRITQEKQRLRNELAGAVRGDNYNQRVW
jgi:hypothetical protein